MRKLTFEAVKFYFEEAGCDLLSTEYVNNSTKLDYVCDCGKPSKIIYNDFKRGVRCYECGVEKVRKARTKYDIDFMRNYFTANGCVLLEASYAHVDHPMKYICHCGNQSTATFSNFKAGKRCVLCGVQKSADNSRQSLAEIKRIFDEVGCEFLSDTYKDSHTHINYKCICGTIAVTTLATFKNGSRCAACKVIKLSGVNSPHWNAKLTDVEREDRRDFKGYREWRTAVYERDDYTCRCCDKRGVKLNAHHLENYSENKALRTDVNNGITLCYTCHRSFHKTYGFRRNNKSQLDEFIAGHLIGVFFVCK